MADDVRELVLPSGETIEVAVTTPRRRGVTPAAADDKAGQAIDLAADVLPRIRSLAGALIDSLKGDAGPQTIALEMGVTLGGKTGIILAEGSAEANLKLTLTWNRP